LLPFRVHQFLLSGRHYLLLPKLNHRQVQTLVSRLQSKGYSVRFSGYLTASLAGRAIHVDPSGLCWSAADPDDAILPAIPALLQCQKEEVTLRDLKTKYFRIQREGKASALRFSTRLESFSHWEELRALGQCGLSPDEHLLASFLMENAKGSCTLLTDFVAECSSPVVYGRGRFFRSKLTSKEAGSTLGRVGERSSRNSYLPRDGTIRLEGGFHPSNADLREAFARMDEWCFFTPS
jgi:hypothetical protein